MDFWFPKPNILDDHIFSRFPLIKLSKKKLLNIKIKSRNSIAQQIPYKKAQNPPQKILIKLSNNNTQKSISTF